ncbi:MAG: TatD family hydrolase [Candidatus Uhrbacteria bacterium]
MIDTHCHVHFNAFKEDMDEVIRRTLEKGVRMVSVGTQATTSANGLKVAEKYDGLWATVGLHPNHLCEQEFFDEQELGGGSPPAPGVDGPVKIKTRCETFDHATYLELARHPKCVAIGECGLDYYRLPENVDRDETIAKQKVTVRQQFDLAHEVGLPVVIHCRDAHADQQAIIREYLEAGKLQRRGVIHCFTGTIEEATAYVELGFLISFTGVITFPPRKTEGPISPLQTVVRDLPLENMMVETDSPYLTPVPHRGERNEPWMVRFVAAKISELKKVSLEEVDRVTTENAKRLFGI